MAVGAPPAAVEGGKEEQSKGTLAQPLMERRRGGGFAMRERRKALTFLDWAWTGPCVFFF